MTIERAYIHTTPFVRQPYKYKTSDLDSTLESETKVLLLSPEHLLFLTRSSNCRTRNRKKPYAVD
jgi:hypothetical protein